MKKILLVIMSMFSLATWAQNFGLYRKVDYLPEKNAPFEWRVFLEDEVSLTPNVYGVFTPYGYKVRAEGLWLKMEGIYGEHLHCEVSLEKNDFPMDDQWDLLWKEVMIFAPDQTFVHTGEIEGRPYRILLKFIKRPGA